MSEVDLVLQHYYRPAKRHLFFGTLIVLMTFLSTLHLLTGEVREVVAWRSRPRDVNTSKGEGSDAVTIQTNSDEDSESTSIERSYADGGSPSLTDIKLEGKSASHTALQRIIDARAKTDNSSKESSPIVATNRTAHNGIDFIVAGFPKCGTSTLLYSFADNEETDMPTTEFCIMAKKIKSVRTEIAQLHEMMKKEFSSPSEDGRTKIRGIKCPVSIHNVRSLALLQVLNPETKVIVGVRHPVLFFQSYYNYRVVSVSGQPKKYKGMVIPDPYELIGGPEKGWRGVFTDLAKYEDSLMQLGKVPMKNSDLKQLARQGLNPAKITLRIFLYDVDQLADPDEERSAKFRSDMQHFLGLEKPISPFDVRNTLANKRSFSANIDICDDKFTDLRLVLMKHGDKTRHWIRDKFMKSEDVVVGGDPNHFLELISKWGEDPCSWNTTSDQ